MLAVGVAALKHRVLFCDDAHGLITSVVNVDVVGFLSAAKDLTLVHHPLVKAHSSDVSTEGTSRIRIVIDAHD